MESAELIVVATEKERDIAKTIFGNDKNVFITGVGGLNVITHMKEIDRNVDILNFGFAGSNSLKVGDSFWVKSCKLYHPNVSYDEPEYILLDHGVKCYTSNDFVLETKIEEPCLFDMELAYILALGFKNVSSMKIVSDNLNLEQYEEGVQDG